MKTFSGIKTLSTIKKQCDQLGLSFDDRQYKRGGDHIAIHGGGAVVLFSSFNGKFFGTTDKNVKFDSSSEQYESCEWFQTLLSFFILSDSSALPPSGYVSCQR
jgi:hypothetical protein